MSCQPVKFLGDPVPFARPGQSGLLLALEPRAALAPLLTGDLDFYTAAGTVGRAAPHGVPVRVVMVSFNRSDLVLLASKEITRLRDLARFVRLTEAVRSICKG